MTVILDPPAVADIERRTKIIRRQTRIIESHLEPAPEPPPTDLPFLIGGTAKNLADFVARVGEPFTYVRRYDSGFPAHVETSSAGPLYPESTPWLTLHHEPENDDGMTPEAWSLAQRQMVEVNAGRITLAINLMGWQMPGPRSVWVEALDGLQDDMLMTIDPYDKSERTRPFSETQAGDAVPYLQDLGWAVGVAETGTWNRTDADFADWLDDGIEWSEDQGLICFGYFEWDWTSRGGRDYRFPGEISEDAYADAIRRRPIPAGRRPVVHLSVKPRGYGAPPWGVPLNDEGLARLDSLITSMTQ